MKKLFLSLLIVSCSLFITCENPFMERLVEPLGKNETQKPVDPTDPAEPILSGTASISGTYRIGAEMAVTADVTGGSGELAYQWKSGGVNIPGANDITYEIQGHDAGKTLSCVVTRDDIGGSVTASGEVVYYDIEVHIAGDESGDSISASSNHGRTGQTITLNYSIIDSADHNMLHFSGTHVPITDVTVHGSGTRQYAVNTADASLEGVINIHAVFVHTILIPVYLEFEKSSGIDKIYGDSAFTNSVTGQTGVVYSSSDTTVASVNSSGQVTILKVGTAEITAAKTADMANYYVPASYTLTITPLQLLIGTPTGSPTKVYDGSPSYTGSGITIGSLTNRVGSDAVTAAISSATYNSANVADANIITIVYSISGASADNYIKPANGTIGATITRAAGAAASGAPTVNGTPTHNSITVNTVTIPSNPGGQTVQYAISTANNTAAETLTWQGGTTFSGLSSGTNYYVYARSAQNANYNAGTASVSAAIKTDVINAQTPLITNITGGGSYSQNAPATLAVTASVTDGGALSYQWYGNATESNTGGAPIGGATGAGYSPPTSTAGIMYYYAVVTNTIADNGDGGIKSASVTSGVAAVTVTEDAPAFTSIDEIANYLATQSGDIDNPVYLSIDMQITEANWNGILAALASAGKYVELDLSVCASSGTTTGGGLRSDGTFDPIAATATGKDLITGIALPDAATSINSGSNSATSAFGSFTNLKTFSGSALTAISSYAFYGRTNLAITSLPTEIISIGEAAFYGCSSLALKELPKGIIVIGVGAFQSCTSLNLSELPEGLTSISNNAFNGCISLVLTKLPDRVTYIGTNAFQNCTSLEQIEIPAGINTIGNNAFNGCSSLAQVTILAVAPPTLGTGTVFPDATTIKVPAGSVDAYKAAWSEYADRISAID
jgi:hypothetical protein